MMEHPVLLANSCRFAVSPVWPRTKQGGDQQLRLSYCHDLPSITLLKGRVLLLDTSADLRRNARERVWTANVSGILVTRVFLTVRQFLFLVLHSSSADIAQTTDPRISCRLVVPIYNTTTTTTTKLTTTIRMKSCVRVVLCLSLALTDAFTPHRLARVSTQLSASTQEDVETTTPSRPKVKQLGLLTFDLDDTLYPIAPVVDAANGKLVVVHCINMPWLSYR